MTGQCNLIKKISIQRCGLLKDFGTTHTLSYSILKGNNRLDRKELLLLRVTLTIWIRTDDTSTSTLEQSGHSV